MKPTREGRLRAVVARIAALPALVILLGLLGEWILDDTGFIVGGVLGATVFGVVADRWWTVVLPLAWVGGYVAVVRAMDVINDECSICTSDDTWGNWPYLMFVAFVLPMTAAVTIGLIGGKLWRSRRPAASAR